MNITFFIGNGFDINLGLKTRYMDFYPFFIKYVSEENIIRKWLKEDDKLWADLEEALGEKLEVLEENELEKFYIDKVELDRLLAEYLEMEQGKLSFSKEEDIRIEFIRSVVNYYDNISLEDKESIENTKGAYKNETFTYQFVSFNYTNTVDKIIDVVKDSGDVIGTHVDRNYNKWEDRIGEVIHIHGTVEEEMILGVNDVSQIKNDILVENEELLDTFIKQRINKQIGQRKTEFVKKIIDNSHLIYVFGMSIGNTDKIWWEEIIRWLMNDINNKLIVYWKGYEDEFKRKIPSITIRINNRVKRKIFNQGKANFEDKEFDNIKDRIIVVYNAEIFKFFENN